MTDTKEKPVYCLGVNDVGACTRIPEVGIVNEFKCAMCASNGGFGFVNEGLGDKVAAFTRKTGLDQVAKKVSKALTGKEDCGCKKRQQALNDAFPGKATSRGTILVMRREVNRKEMLDCVRESLSDRYTALDVEIPFTLEAIKAECEKHSNVKAIIRAEEHGKLFVNNNWRKACKWAKAQGIKMLHVDFGYFDHYESRLIGEYEADGTTRMHGWGSYLDLSNGSLPKYIEAHIEKVTQAGDRARAQASPYPFGYVCIWTGCHAALAYQDFRAPKADWLRIMCGHIVSSGYLPVIKDSPLSSFDKPAGVEVVTGRDIDQNALLAVHAVNNIIINSTVSNELVLWGVPVTALGSSWYDGKDVFHVPESWRDAVQPGQINKQARADWIQWWIHTQIHKDDLPAEIIRRVS